MFNVTLIATFEKCFLAILTKYVPPSLYISRLMLLYLSNSEFIFVF